MIFYRLQISTTDDRAVEALLGEAPFDPSLGWFIEREAKDGDPYVDYIGEFLAILKGKYEALAKIGVERSDISVWMLREYDQQCNMEFSPAEMMRLGKEGITLCVSCWKKASASFDGEE